MIKINIFILAILLPFIGYSQWKYPSYSQFQSTVKELGSHRLSTIQEIGKSYGGHPISVIKLGNTKVSTPALLIIAGIDGQHPAAVWSAIGVVQHLLKMPADSLSNLLSKKSIWIIPLANPDAYQRNAANSIQLASGNARQIDNDRDGRMDEDPPKDLNADGLISQMRIKSKVGTYKAHPDFPHYLVGVDASKGVKGEYELYTEGVDIDHDDLFGEDGLSGVNIDKNFTFDYGAFESETGDYAASEPETRAILDFIYENPNIATVLHFGLQNNLSHPESFDSGKAYSRIVKSWSSADVQVSNYVSQLYNDLLKPLGPAPKANASKGNFSTTAYYHAGRFSFVTPTWWTPTLPDSVKSKLNVSKETYGSIENERFVLWAQHNNIQDAILPWTKVSHPNFPNHEVEVGGIVEFYKNNPPQEMLSESQQLHQQFVVRLLESMAVLEFGIPKVTPLGNDVFRLELQIYNTGNMPTYPEIGDRIRHVSRLKTIIDIQKNQQFLSGKRLQLYSTLGAGKTQNFSWLIKGKGKVSIAVGCPSAGESIIEVTL